MMADNNVIYLEADEDITSAIDKLMKAASTQIQVVAAKRSTLIQSKTNLRLLKKSADDAGKKLILITSDPLATNLASRIGLAVASQVGETPRIPASPVAARVDDDVVEDDGLPAADDEPVATTAVTPVPPSPPLEPAAPPAITRAPIVPPTPAKAAVPKAKVPNFSIMQKRIIWIGAGVVGVALLFGLNYYLTSAKVTLYAKATKIDAGFDLTADPAAPKLNAATAVIPATTLTIAKTLNANVQSTGQKDVGTKAGGKMTVSNCYDNSPHTLVAGTRFKSPDGLMFLSTDDVTVPGGAGSFFGCTAPGTVTVPVQAEANGDKYNLASGTKYTIPGLSAAQQSGIMGQGAQMQGGTSKTIQVLLQVDVDKAKQAALEASKAGIQKEFNDKAGKAQLAIAASLGQVVGTVTSSPPVGSEAQQSSLVIQITYTELGVNRSELSTLTKTQEVEQVGDKNQIYEDGSASLQLTAKPGGVAGGAQTFHAITTAYGGAKVDKDALAKALKGKKYGEAADIAGRQPGIDRADLTISPAWATSMPGITSHIHIIIKAANIGK